MGAGEQGLEDTATEADTATNATTDGDTDAGAALNAAAGAVTDDREPSPYADIELPVASAESEMLVPSDSQAPTNVGEGRHVVYTARYRLTRKGPDRGKWLFEIAATADAPLATVEQVARGVTLRSRDLTDTERLSGEQLRALMGDPAWRTPM